MAMWLDCIKRKEAIKQCNEDESLTYCYVSNDSLPQW